ncbi:MAG: hypothetical protein OXG87_08725 [Gemmatimonadetes bacterium]|nr:hypothetical protein [Gemmatimonadota bacterium]
MAISERTTEAPETVAEPQGMTLRAFILAMITIAGVCLFATYYGRNLMKSFLPVTALLPLVVWIGINTALKLAAPRFALSRSEVVTIFGIVWMVATVPAIGWVGYLITDISAPAAFSSPENRFWEVAGQYLPRWLFMDRGSEVVERLYVGLEHRDEIPWAHWVVPLFWWFVGSLSLVLAGFFASVLFYKQWLLHERLSFPLATVPLALLEESEGSRVPDVFKDWVFWAGFACIAGVIFWNITGYFVLTLPRITIYDHWLTTAVDTGQYIPTIYLRIHPLMMGLAYLCPLNILMSFWFFFLVNAFKMTVMNRTGFTIGLQGQTATPEEILMLEAHGALVFLVIWSVWVARDHLKETLHKAFGDLRSQDDGVPVSYRTAWLGFLSTTIFFTGFLLSMGISLPSAMVQMGLLFVIYLGVTKFAAATGYVFLAPQGEKGWQIMKALYGTLNISSRDLTGLIVVSRNALAGAPARMLSVPAIPHFFKLLGNGLQRSWTIAGVLPVALLGAFAVACAAQLYLCYMEGGLNHAYMPDWRHMVRQVSLIEGTQPAYFDLDKTIVWLLGIAEAGLLTLLGMRYAAWPIHPFGLAFPDSRFRYGFGIFIVWLAKSLTLRFGGVSLYRRSLPFWYGIVVGYLVGVGASTIVDAIWFPLNRHFVHGW